MMNQLSQYNNSWSDYCTCRRCPCCGKIVRNQPMTQIWGGDVFTNCSQGGSSLDTIRESIRNAQISAS